MYSNLQSFAFVAICLSALTTADFVAPYPVSDCSQGLVIAAAACPNQPGCCAGGAACCAGGCCPINANCVNQGTSDEACCTVGDSTNCGVSVASYSPAACTAGGSFPKPSVQCVSVEHDWKCPPGSICGAVVSNCITFPQAECTSDAVDDGPSATATSDPSTSDTTETYDPTETPDANGGSAIQNPAASPTGDAVLFRSPPVAIAGIGALLELVL